jgi:Ca2+-binding EF-hand superfamily protein
MKRSSKKDGGEEVDLSPEEIDFLKEQFFSMDKHNQGSINQYELRSVLEAVGDYPTDDKMRLISQMLEEKGFRKIDLTAAMKAWSYLKELNTKDEDEIDNDICKRYTVNAFVAMGGNIDRSGSVRKQRLIDIIKVEFGLTVDIEAMFEEAGLDIDEELNFYEFTCLLEAGGSQRASRICSLFSVASVG